MSAGASIRTGLGGELEQAAAGRFTVDELVNRPDAEDTFARIASAVDDDTRDAGIVVTLTALAVLRSRAAAEQQLIKETM